MIRRRGVGLVLLILVAVATYSIVWRAAGSPVAWEDSYWLERAVLGESGGTAAHVLLLRAFLGLTGGPFAAARSASAFLLSLTVVALAIGAANLAPASRRVLLPVTGFVLLAQPFLFADAGAVLPELSAMAWVSLGLAICLRQPTAPQPRRRLAGALALGAVTAIAVRAHPGGLILLWPGLLLLRQDGRWAPRRAAGRLAAWTVGALIAWFGIGAAFALGGGHATAAAAGLDAAPALSAWRWVDVLWSAPAGSGGVGDLRALALLVVGAALAAAGTSLSLERRLLHAMPLVFVGGLLVGRLFASEPLTAPDLLPILPAACLLGGALFVYAGLGRLSLRRLSTWPFLLPAAALAAEVVVVAPYLSGALGPEEILPWLPPVAAGDLVRRTLGPTIAVTLVIAGALSLARPRLRLPVLLAAAVLALGPGFSATTRLLATRQPAQRADLTLYPWHQLGDAMTAAQPKRIAVSPALLRDSAMFGPAPTMERVARLYFGDPSLELASDPRSLRQAEIALVTPAEARRRLAGESASRYRAELDDAGRIVLLRRRGKKAPRDRQKRRELRRRERREKAATGGP